MNALNKNENSFDKKWKLVNFCEFDQYATKSYCAIHNEPETKNLGDITKVDETKLEPFTMICGGSPCQDFSVAGKQKGSVWTCKDCGHEYNPLTVHWSERHKCPNCGSENLEKTRSSLLVEYLRVIRANKPKFGMYENVKNIVGKQFKETTFKLFTDELEEYGYNVYWKVLNAKNYGIPQNRERVYLIFIRKDIDNDKFKFPEPFDNGIRLKDILEDEVDEKYYVSEDKVKKFLQNLHIEKDDENSNIPHFIGNINRPDFGTGYAGGVWDAKNISPTLTTMQGGGRQPHILQGIDKSLNQTKYIDVANCLMTREDRGVSDRKSEGTAILEYANRTVLLGNCGEKLEKETDIANTLLARDYKGFGNQDMNAVIRIPQATETGVCRIESPIRIRKLTPKECFRLMGFSDKDFEAAANVVSNSQLYKQAGNSIVSDVLYYILRELYVAMPYLFDDLRLSSFFSGIGAFEIALNRLYKDINSGNFTSPQAE